MSVGKNNRGLPVLGVFIENNIQLRVRGGHG
jgi:hypothetical protein